MSNVPDDLKYTAEHEWVKVDGAEVTIGVTDHAQSEMGDITYVELPDVGGDVDKGNDVVALESVKAASDVYAPVSGKIVAVNTELEDSPELVNSAPYGDGWLVRIEMADASQLDALMDAAAYREHIENA